MPRPLGFSTGSLIPGDTRKSVQLVEGLDTTAIELSALRVKEIPELLAAISSHAWDRFEYISVHAPSRYPGISEAEVVLQLQPALDRGWSLTIHPDSLGDWDVWARLGPMACIENMDNRKEAGRTVQELEDAFRRLPAATFCLDLAHARSVDPTMSLARELLTAFGARLRQVHLSELDDICLHEPLTLAALEDYRPLVPLIPDSVAIILETPVDVPGIAEQVALARLLFR